MDEEEDDAAEEDVAWVRPCTGMIDILRDVRNLGTEAETVP
jgi:hypothetical protein